jgi:hypothetical protein
MQLQNQGTALKAAALSQVLGEKQWRCHRLVAYSYNF